MQHSSTTFGNSMTSGSGGTSSLAFLDLPLGDGKDTDSEIRYFDALEHQEHEPLHFEEKTLIPGPRADQGPSGWGPRVKKARRPAAPAEAWPQSRARKGSDWLSTVFLVALVLPLGAALGHFVSPAPPVVVLSPEFLEFDTVTVGETRALQLTLENRGEKPLEILGLTLTGADFGLGTEDCRAGALAPGATCDIQLAFRPSEMGPRKAELLVRSNGVDDLRVLPLLGTGG